MASYNYFWPGFHGGQGPQPAFSQAQQGSLSQPQSQVLPNCDQASEDSKFTNMDSKILNPTNKKDFQLYILRHISANLDDPTKLKIEISK